MNVNISYRKERLEGEEIGERRLRNETKRRN
jgi:hypothetical protein